MTSPTLSPTPTDALTRTWTCVLFDLDGTLTDSAPGITASLAETFRRLGRAVPSDDELLGYVGPPLLESFRVFAGMNPEQVLEAAELYRTVSSESGSDLNNNAVFPGMKGLLVRLQAAGVPLAIATSKPEWRAREILEHFGLAEYFTVITGASVDEVRSAKADVVAEAIRRLAEQGIDLEQAVMVGDRAHDVLGAGEHGIPTILVEWGYGSPAEAAGAIAIVHSVDQLSTLLLG
ncbi:HAD hydrolase-like protein [Microbacterium sp. STN6]|uniref:HAD hydrolase-like protein n=1 Tax=Microbacterium sp. STN6 TaxID=2995588 RepID=UPI002260E19A|nr:HAD hydrolase-like protein [Microbacterium sp. STN6]MCX7522685.1 HAD hydrolase-like protein [Microbacterium sp. STN6]